MVQVADEAVGGGAAEGQGVSPEIPLEDDDAEGHHDHPYERQGGLSSRQAGVEECDARDHDQDHAGRDDDVGLVAGLVPLVQVFGFCARRSGVRDCAFISGRRRSRPLPTYSL